MGFPHSYSGRDDAAADEADKARTDDRKHTLNVREIAKTDSGRKTQAGKVVPVTAYEVLDPGGVIVAIFWNNRPTPANRSPKVCAIMECDYRNGTLNKWGKGLWSEVRKGFGEFYQVMTNAKDSSRDE